jgi:hypothetical protein
MSVIITAVVAVSLCVAGPAQAKGVSAVTVCGADSCRDFTDQSRIHFFGPAGGPADPPRSATGWYRVTVAIGAEGGPPEQRLTLAALPDEGLIRASDGSWMSIYPQAAPAYRDAVRGLEPLPASELGLAPPPAPESDTAGDPGGDGVPWLLVALGGVACLVAIAFTPPVRRRFGGPQSSS